MSSPLERKILQITERVWDVLLGIALRPREPAELQWNDASFTIAYVGVSGAWRGEVLLACDAELVRYAAARLYELDAEEVTDMHVRETIYELGNVLAGNLKQLLPEPSALKIPVVGHGDNLRVRIRVPDDPSASRIAVDCYGWPMLVALARHS